MNHHFELTNTIPVPKTTRSGRYSKYPFKVMNVNDSFFVPGAKRNTVYQAAHKAGAAHERKFVVRPVVERGAPGVRVWRVA